MILILSVVILVLLVLSVTKERYQNPTTIKDLKDLLKTYYIDGDTSKMHIVNIIANDIMDYTYDNVEDDYSLQRAIAIDSAWMSLEDTHRKIKMALATNNLKSLLKQAKNIGMFIKRNIRNLYEHHIQDVIDTLSKAIRIVEDKNIKSDLDGIRLDIAINMNRL
jgi:hypothetical protein